MNKVSISNKHIYVDDEILERTVSKMKPILYDGYEIYCFQDVQIFNVSGSMLVYFIKGKFDRITFTALNALSVFNVKIIFDEYIALQKLKEELNSNYRKKDPKHYYTKSFNIIITNCSNNLAITIIRRIT